MTRNRFSYGWVIVFVATLALVVSNGLSTLGLPVFFKPIQDDLLALGAVTLQTKDAVTGTGGGLTVLLAGVFSLIVGLFIDRFRLKVLMGTGCLILGSGLVYYSFAATPADVYLSHSLLGLSLGFAGVMVQTVLISKWFRRRRGTAMGIVLTGTSLGGVIIPLLAAPLIGQYGWRIAMRVLSLLVWAILLPAVLFLVRERRAENGEEFDGDEQTRSESESAIPGSTFAAALSSPVFWIIALCAALVFYPIFAISQLFNLYLQNNIGVSSKTAAFAQSTLFVLSICGKFSFGWLCDRFPTRVVIIACSAIMFASTLMLLGLLGPSTVFVFIIPFGLGYGGTFVLIQLLTVETFGLRDIGKILGTITLIETLGGFLGSAVTGRLAGLNSGDYTFAFYGVTIAAGLAFLATLGIFAFDNKGHNRKRERPGS